MKVGLLDKDIRKQFYKFCSKLTAILTAVLIFIDIPRNFKLLAGIIYLTALVIAYLIYWHTANKIKQTTIKIGLTTVAVKSGDIFEEDGLKAIAFNEYFDTTVDDKIIAKKSLNGQFILNHIDNVNKLNSNIESDDDLKNSIIEKE